MEEISNPAQLNIKTICFTGPESTGKSTFCEYLSKKNKWPKSQEFAREYLINKISYAISDLSKIAFGQLKNNNNINIAQNQKTIFDTDLLTIKIWSEYKYGYCDEEIIQLMKKNFADLYIICYPDTQWIFDPLRENPNDRLAIYNIYKKNLEEYQLNYIELKGNWENKLKILDHLN